MFIKIKLSTNYHCSLERAFKTPMLCDVTKVHTGYGLMPKVIRCSDDEQWGQIGSSKKVYVAKSPTQAGGFASVDTVLERIENSYWKIEVSEFQAWMLGFYKFTGEWQTTELDPDKIQIDYTYTLHAKNVWLYPFNWLFAKLFWKAYMQQVLNNIETLIKQNEPYQYP
jgi:hypothetical protein